jgi:hypothetical protein
MPEIISWFLCNCLIELSPTFSCEYYFFLYTFKCVPNILICYMINLRNSVTIFTCIYLLEHFATFNMGTCACVGAGVGVGVSVLQLCNVTLHYSN